jgi:hypothetical protein
MLSLIDAHDVPRVGESTRRSETATVRTTPGSRRLRRLTTRTPIRSDVDPKPRSCSRDAPEIASRETQHHTHRTVCSTQITITPEQLVDIVDDRTGVIGVCSRSAPAGGAGATRPR